MSVKLSAKIKKSIWRKLKTASDSKNVTRSKLMLELLHSAKNGNLASNPIEVTGKRAISLKIPNKLYSQLKAYKDQNHLKRDQLLEHIIAHSKLLAELA